MIRPELLDASESAFRLAQTERGTLLRRYGSDQAIGTIRQPSLSVNSRAAKHQMTRRLLAQ